MKLVQHPLIATIMNVYRHFQRGAISTLAAAVAYHTLFAFVPLLLFLTAMVGVVSRVIGIDSVMSNLTDWLYHRSGLPPRRPKRSARPSSRSCPPPPGPPSAQARCWRCTAPKTASEP